MRLLLALFVLTGAVGLSGPMHQTGVSTRLASIRVKGNQRYPLQDIESLSGLEIGKPIAPADLTTAADRLAKTGLFAHVQYTYTTNGPQMDVTLLIEEAPSTIPVIFDNIVWLSDAEIVTALRAYVPEFDGKTTLYTGAPDFVAAGLQKVLETRKLPGHINITPLFTVSGTKADPVGFVLAVTNPSPTVCAVHVSGASAISEKDLVAQLAGVGGGSYSRSFLKDVSAGTLTDMYRRKGYWRAAFAEPAAALNQCDGVAVTLTVAEGTEYAWDHAVWTGNIALASDALDKLLAVKPGEPAESGKLDLGMLAIRHEYGKRGYVEADLTDQPQLDDAAHRATFLFNIREGPRYTMGTLQFIGIRDADAEKLRKEWHLKAGDVFDEEYMTKYQSDVLAPLQSPSGGRPVISMSLDRDHHIVNLSVAVR